MITPDYFYLKQFNVAILSSDHKDRYLIFKDYCCRISNIELEKSLVETPFIVAINSETIISLCDLCFECNELNIASPILTLLGYNSKPKTISDIHKLARAFGSQQIIKLNGKNHYLRCFDGYVNLLFPQFGLFPYFYQLLDKPTAITVSVGQYWHEFSPNTFNQIKIDQNQTKVFKVPDSDQLEKISLLNLFFIQVGIDEPIQILSMQNKLIEWLNDDQLLKRINGMVKSMQQETKLEYLELSYVCERHKNSKYFQEIILPKLKQNELSLSDLKVLVLTQLEVINPIETEELL